MTKKILLALMFFLALAACGEDRSTDDGKVAEPSALKFSQCMRDQGYGWYPDPDSAGNLQANEPDGLDRATYEKAQKTCEKYAPWGGGGEKKSAEDLDKLRKVSQCIRENGFPTFPDPDDNGNVSLGKDSGISPDDPAFRKVRQECER